MKLDFFTRAHTINPHHGTNFSSTGTVPPSKWPPCICVFDTETTEDIEQNLEFGCYQFCQLTEKGYEAREEGIFYTDLVSANIAKLNSVIDAYAAKHEANVTEEGLEQLQVRPRTDFVENVLW